MTDNRAILEEMLKAILAEPNPELRAAMSRALRNTMNDPEIEKPVIGESTMDKIVVREMQAYMKVLKLEKATS
jgi:hypothetical protein